MAKIPESIGKYQVLEQLAQGGMGAVYTARHPTLERTVIIKKLTLRGNADMRERFRREAQIMMDLRNDAIVDVYDHFREGSSYYIVLEYVEGPSLEQLIGEERYLPADAALLILREVCRGLAYAHERGVVHRDIKPANILLSRAGEVKLVDFGIATIHGDEESGLTREGMTLGTPSYMAPEQFQNTRNVDRRADIYSIGVILYEMVTGKKPFPGSISPEAVARIQKGRYPKPRRVNPRVTPFCARLIRRCMRVRPDRRVGSLTGLVRRIDRKLRLHRRANLVERLKSFLETRKTPPKRSMANAVGWVVLAVFALALGSGAAFSVERGYHLELFQPELYGAVEASIRVARQAKAPDDIFIRTVISPADAENESATTSLRYRLIPNETTETYYVFRSHRLQLPAGSYRVGTEVEGSVYRESFLLEPLRSPAESGLVVPGRSLDAHRLSLVHAERDPLPLSVEWQVRDRETGEDISAGTRLWVIWDGRRRAWSEALSKELESGRPYRFRFSRPGYLSSELSVSLASEQSRLRLTANLTPTPAILRISSAPADTVLRLNGSTSYQSGDRRAGISPVPRLGSDPVELVLAPGTYELSARSEDNTLSSERIRLRSGYREAVRLEMVDGDLRLLNEGAEVIPRNRFDEL